MVVLLSTTWACGPALNHSVFGQTSSLLYCNGDQLLAFGALTMGLLLNVSCCSDLLSVYVAQDLSSIQPWCNLAYSGCKDCTCFMAATSLCEASYNLFTCSLAVWVLWGGSGGEDCSCWHSIIGFTVTLVQL